jgi:hypothetical protein
MDMRGFGHELPLVPNTGEVRFLLLAEEPIVFCGLEETSPGLCGRPSSFSVDTSGRIRPSVGLVTTVALKPDLGWVGPCLIFYDGLA